MPICLWDSIAGQSNDPAYTRMYNRLTEFTPTEGLPIRNPRRLLDYRLSLIDSVVMAAQDKVRGKCTQQLSKIKKFRELIYGKDF